MTLLRKYEKYRENYPHVKGLDSIFAKFSLSENNHVYSMSVCNRYVTENWLVGWLFDLRCISDLSAILRLGSGR